LASSNIINLILQQLDKIKFCNIYIDIDFTTATAADFNICVGESTPRYATFAARYVTITMDIEIIIARGRFLKSENLCYNYET